MTSSTWASKYLNPTMATVQHRQQVSSCNISHTKTYITVWQCIVVTPRVTKWQSGGNRRHTQGTKSERPKINVQCTVHHLTGGAWSKLYSQNNILFLLYPSPSLSHHFSPSPTRLKNSVLFKFQSRLPKCQETPLRHKPIKHPKIGGLASNPLISATYALCQI